MANQNNHEFLCYFYHPDHLGSSSFITGATGEPTQHLEYLPFGELFIEERSTWNTPYKFSAKELDDETGYSYFGARYYDPNISIWLSVDPLSDLFPGYSPYNYALNNPLRLIDPNGMGPVIPPNGETTNAGEGYQATQDGKYLYGEGLRTKVWNPELDYGPGSGSSGKGGFEDYKGEPIDFGSYGSNQGNNDRGNSTWEWASAVTGGESILVGEAAKTVDEALFKTISKSANVVGGLMGTVDNTVQAVQEFRAGNNVTGALQASQAVTNLIGTALLFTPLAPLGGAIILVNGAIDLGEFIYNIE